MSVMPYGGLPNFGNAISGALMPFMAQSSMPSSLPEPQPARAADAATTTPAAASSTNPHPTDTRPQSHSRRSRSRHRRHRHSHSHTSHHRGHDKSLRRHTTRRARSSSRSPLTAPPPLQAIAPQPHLPPLTLPPAQVLPTILPRTQDHGSTSSPANPHLPRFHFPAHFWMGHRQVSMVLSTLVEPIVGTPTAEPQPPQHQQHRQLEQSGQATVLATAATWATNAPPIPCQPQQRQHAPYPCTRGGFPNPPPRPAPPQPSPQHPSDDIEDLDPPPSEAELNTNSDNRWLDLWRSVMDTAKTDPMRVPTPRELGELDPLPALDISRMEQTKATLTSLDPALPPSHADRITWHGVRNHLVSPTTPLAGRWRAPGGWIRHSFPSRCHVCTRHRMRRMSYENMIRPAAWRPENHDYPSLAFELHHVSAWGHRFWGTALCQSAQDLGVRGKPRGPAQSAAPLCMPQRQEVVPSLQVCHAERCRAAAPGVAGREPYHIPCDQEKN